MQLFLYEKLFPIAGGLGKRAHIKAEAEERTIIPELLQGYRDTGA